MANFSIYYFKNGSCYFVTQAQQENLLEINIISNPGGGTSCVG